LMALYCFIKGVSFPCVPLAKTVVISREYRIRL
jgi:hypothetical protein